MVANRGSIKSSHSEEEEDSCHLELYENFSPVHPGFTVRIDESHRDNTLILRVVGSDLRVVFSWGLELHFQLFFVS